MNEKTKDIDPELEKTFNELKNELDEILPVLELLSRIYGDDTLPSEIADKLDERFGEGKWLSMLKIYPDNLTAINTEKDLFTYISQSLKASPRMDKNYRVSPLAATIGYKPEEGKMHLFQRIDGLRNELQLETRYYSLSFFGRNFTYEQLIENHPDIIKVLTLLENSRAGNVFQISGNVYNILSNLGWDIDRPHYKRLEKILWIIAEMGILYKSGKDRVIKSPIAKYEVDTKKNKIERIYLFDDYFKYILNKFPFIDGGTSLKNLKGKLHSLNDTIRTKIHMENKKQKPYWRIGFVKFIQNNYIPFNLKNPTRELKRLKATLDKLPGIKYEVIIDGKSFGTELEKVRELGVVKRKKFNPELQKRAMMQFFLIDLVCS